MVTLNRSSNASVSWMEHQILEHVKQALRVTLDWKAPAVSMPHKLSSMKFTLKSFQRHLDRLMTIEEDGGYMSVVADAKPYLQSQIDALEAEHDCFRNWLGRINHEVEDLGDWQAEDFEEACREIRMLLEEVDRHDDEEITLLQESLLSDEGGEG